MNKEDSDVLADDLHSELPGVGSVADDAQGVAGFAFDTDGASLPCAVSVASYDSPFVIRIHGDIDIHSYTFLAERIGRVINITAGRGTGERDLLIDLNHCTYLDSRGMGLLIKAARDAQSAGGRLSLIHLSPKVHKVFDVTGMDKILTVVP